MRNPVWRLLAAVPVLALLVCAPPAVAEKARAHEAPQPFGLTMGKSSLDEAQAMWKKENASVVGRGFGDAKPGYGDNDKEGVANERIEMVDVDGLPLDQLQRARFGFFSGTLYFLRYQFAEGTDFEKLFRQVTAKYGAPTRQSGFGDLVYEWKFGAVRLAMEKKFIGQHTMFFVHEPVATKAQRSNAEVYAQHIKDKAKAAKAF